MEFGIKEWTQLGAVSTIYEEEDDDDSCSTIKSLDFSSSPSPNPHFSRLMKPWNYLSLARKNEILPDVVIHVRGSSFSLHKEALMARSTYLKRHLREFPEITLSPPLNITAATFSLVADFCYGIRVAFTPFNVAALRTAAELLGMTEDSCSSDENLVQKTEAYFRSAVVVSKECTSTVLKSCFELLPEAETAACLVSRCIAALSLADEVDGDFRWLDEVKRLGIRDLVSVLDPASQRLTDCHDFLYRIIDAYLKANIATVSDEQKIQMCNYIDCSILSPKFLMHAVQNPRMPLRFVVQAMFVEQLNTRASIISAADSRVHHKSHQETLTLGAILQRDATLRQVSQLKSIMSTTNSRIQTLEKELGAMRKLLKESETARNRIDAGRSASFRFSSEGSNKVERGQIGSVSSTSYRDAAKRVRGHVSPSETSDGNTGVEMNFGRRLMNGIKSAFRFSRKRCDESKSGGATEKINGSKLEGDGINDHDDADVVRKKNEMTCHRRSRSQS